MAPPLPLRAAAVSALLAACVTLGAVSGCAGVPTSTPPGAGASAPLPLFRLPPATLGRRLAWQQRLQLERDGQAMAPLEALLEVDAQRLQLALLAPGRTLARLTWDGRDLHSETAAGWPPAVPPERVLSDLQLALWPAQALRQALPAGYRLDDTDGQRVLWQGDEAVVRVQGAGSPRIELVHHRLAYRLRIDSVPLAEEPGA
ncbi:DUF3261 domain-containing protein [Ideonella sp.]|uniref:DUF3261 domain-containing protein n=1 Tax=Ideonella sp. TaxID=1929293 RepID=UPI0035B4DB63